MSQKVLFRGKLRLMFMFSHFICYFFGLIMTRNFHGKQFPTLFLPLALLIRTPMKLLPLRSYRQSFKLPECFSNRWPQRAEPARCSQSFLSHKTYSWSFRTLTRFFPTVLKWSRYFPCIREELFYDQQEENPKRHLSVIALSAISFYLTIASQRSWMFKIVKTEKL